jgi:hypothetical protein
MSEPATDAEMADIRGAHEGGFLRLQIEVPDYVGKLLARLDAERARAEAAEAKLATAREALQAVSDSGLLWGLGVIYEKTRKRVSAALDATSLHNPQRTGGEG